MADVDYRQKFEQLQKQYEARHKQVAEARGALSVIAQNEQEALAQLQTFGVANSEQLQQAIASEEAAIEIELNAIDQAFKSIQIVPAQPVVAITGTPAVPGPVDLAELLRAGSR